MDNDSGKLTEEGVVTGVGRRESEGQRLR